MYAIAYIGLYVISRNSPSFWINKSTTSEPLLTSGAVVDWAQSPPALIVDSRQSERILCAVPKSSDTHTVHFPLDEGATEIPREGFGGNEFHHKG